MRALRLCFAGATGARATHRLTRWWAGLLAALLAVAGAAGLGGVAAWLLRRWLDFELDDLVPGAQSAGFADLHDLG